MINYSHNLTIATVLHWHKELFGQTKKDQAGKLRTYDVEISGSNYQPTHAIELAFLLREFFEWYYLLLFWHLTSRIPLVCGRFAFLLTFAGKRSKNRRVGRSSQVQAFAGAFN